MLSSKKSLTKLILMGLLASSNVIWGSAEVQAEEASQSFMLDPMLVTAQREEKKGY